MGDASQKLGEFFSRGDIQRTFAFIEICEDMLAAAKAIEKRRRSPSERIARIDRVFRVAFPTIPLRNKSEDLYRAHVAELIDRSLHDDDARPATEIVGALSDAFIPCAAHSDGE